MCLRNQAEEPNCRLISAHRTSFQSSDYNDQRGQLLHVGLIEREKSCLFGGFLCISYENLCKMRFFCKINTIIMYFPAIFK